MSEMFKNYPQSENYIPDNRPRKCPGIKLDIMTGETSKHTFEVPFDVTNEEEVADYEVIYKLGLKPVIIRNSYSLEALKTPCGSTITCELSPEETKLFQDTLLSTRVQIKFYMAGGIIMFSDIYNVKVMDALDMTRSKPEENTNMVYGTNYGWTED